MSVYFIRRASDGAIKIGMSHDITKRHRTIAREIGEPVELVREVLGYRRTEAWFHKRFAEQRLSPSGEWFVYHEDMLTTDCPIQGDNSDYLYVEWMRCEVPLRWAQEYERFHATILSEEEFNAGLFAALKKRIGKGKPWSVRDLAKEIRVPQQTVWTWMTGRSAPNGANLLNLIRVFGATFANEAIQMKNALFLDGNCCSRPGDAW